MKKVEQDIQTLIGAEIINQKKDYIYYIEKRMSEAEDSKVWMDGIYHMFGYSNEDLDKMSYDDTQKVLLKIVLAINEYEFNNFGNTPYYLYEGENKELYQKFIDYIYQPLFSHSENPISKLSINNQLDYLLKCIDKGLKIDPLFMHELEYKISFGDISKIAEHIIPLLNNYGVEKQIIILDMLTALFRFQNYAEDSKEIFWNHIKNGLKTNNKSVFFHYYGNILGECRSIMHTPTKDYKVIIDNKVKFIDNNGDIKDYLEVIEEILINIGYKNFDNKAFVKAIQSLHTQNFIEVINKDLNIDITQLTLQSQIFFLKFLWGKTPKEFEEFKQILSTIDEKHKVDFMTTFLACSKSKDMGQVILELANYEGSQKIFVAYAKLVNLQSEIEDDDINTREFLKAILGRGEKLLKESLVEYKDGKSVAELEERYSSNFVKNIAFTRALIHSHKTGDVLPMEEFNENAPGFILSTFQGDPSLLRNTDIASMVDVNNYTDSEKFSIKDYNMIYDSYQTTYQNIDAGWGKLLQENIAKDVTNPKVHFFMIRDEEDELLAVCKLKKLENGDIYAGTHYVKHDYQQDTNFGSYVLNYAIAQFRDAPNIVGDVAPSNTSLERHINYGGFICDGIGIEKNERYSSKEFFTVRSASKMNLVTKNKELYPDSKLKSMQGESHSGDIIVKKFDSSPENVGELLETSKNYFEQGFVISRVFYDKKDGSPDPHQMHVTFEKINKGEEL